MNYIIMFIVTLIGAVIVTFLVKQNRKVKEAAQRKREKLQRRIKRHEEE